MRHRRDAALVTALDENARDLLRYLERRVGTDDAPDALSETMVAAWKAASRLPPAGAEARMWLFGIARNVVLNTVRGDLRRYRLSERLREKAAVTPDTQDTGPQVEVRDAIDRLHPDLAEIVRAVHWDGFSLVEISQYLSLPASTVRSRYDRAKKELAQALSPQPHLAG